MENDFELELWSTQTEMIVLGTFYKEPAIAFSYFDIVNNSDFHDKGMAFFHTFFCSYILDYSDEITQAKSNTWASMNDMRLKGYKKFGGWKTIASLMPLAVSEEELKHQIDILKKFALLRALNDDGYDVSKILSLPKFNSLTVDDCARYVNGSIEKICNGIITGLDEPIDLSADADSIVNGFMDTPLRGIDTAFPFLNDLASGLVPGDLTAIGATSNSGKGRSLIFLAAHLALCEGANVAFYGNEMSAQSMQLAYFTTVLNSPKIRKLIGGNEIIIPERNLSHGLFEDSNRDLIYRRVNNNGEYIETEDQYRKRVYDSSQQYRDVLNAMQWLKEYGKKKLLFKNVAAAYDDASLSRVIKQNRLINGTDVFFYDTLKNSNKKDLGDWASLVATATMLKETNSINKMCGIVSFQMIPAANQMKIEELDINAVQAAKQIYNLMDTMTMMLHAKKELYGNYSVKRDEGISPRHTNGFDDDDSLDEQEFYTFWKLVKNRRGSKDNLICMRTDLNRNLWQQEGILIPKT